MNSTPQTLNIVQYNVNKSRNRVMSAFFQAVDPKKHHILAIQEPWRNPQMPTTIRPPNYHLVYPLRHDTRVCFYVSKVLDPNKWKVTEHSPDLLTLTINLDDDRGVLQLLPPALDMAGEHILLGDFNLHHPMWGGVLLPTQHALSDDLIDITLRTSLQLILPPGSITWHARQTLTCVPCD